MARPDVIRRLIGLVGRQEPPPTGLVAGPAQGAERTAVPSRGDRVPLLNDVLARLQPVAVDAPLR
jgi:hypothetical protein